MGVERRRRREPLRDGPSLPRRLEQHTAPDLQGACATKSVCVETLQQSGVSGDCRLIRRYPGHRRSGRRWGPCSWCSKRCGANIWRRRDSAKRTSHSHASSRAERCVPSSARERCPGFLVALAARRMQTASLSMSRLSALPPEVLVEPSIIGCISRSGVEGGHSVQIQTSSTTNEISGAMHRACSYTDPLLMRSILRHRRAAHSGCAQTSSFFRVRRCMA